MRTQGLLKTSNVKNWQRLEKELGAKIDELGLGKS